LQRALVTSPNIIFDEGGWENGALAVTADGHFPVGHRVAQFCNDLASDDFLEALVVNSLMKDEDKSYLIMYPMGAGVVGALDGLKLADHFVRRDGAVDEHEIQIMVKMCSLLGHLTSVSCVVFFDL
jgi:hypothetical protein